jgi:hypothetical protein
MAVRRGPWDNGTKHDANTQWILIGSMPDVMAAVHNAAEETRRTSDLLCEFRICKTIFVGSCSTPGKRSDGSATNAECNNRGAVVGGDSGVSRRPRAGQHGGRLTGDHILIR